MNTLLWVLAGVLVYSAAATALSTRGYLPEAVRVQGPLTTLHTTVGRRFLGWVAGPRRFWRAWSNVGVGVALVVMAGMFLFLLRGAVVTLQNPTATTANQPSNFLLVPGVNDFLPLAVAPEIVAGLAIALVVHEAGHGLLYRVEGVDIDSLGLVLFTIIPIGAFAQPVGEEGRLDIDRGANNRVFAAGVTNNFAVTIVAYALLFGPVIGAITAAPGVAVAGVYPGTAASDAGIGAGDRITAVGGQPIDGVDDLDAALDDVDDPAVEIGVNGESTTTLDRRVVVIGSTPGNPAGFSVGGDGEAITVSAVNGTTVRTEATFEEAAARHELARLETSAGNVTVPLGAYVRSGSGPLAGGDGPPANTSLVVTRLDGQRVVDDAALSSLLTERSPDDTVSLRAYVDGEFQNYTVTLAEGPQGDATLGGVARGTSGLVVGDVGVRTYPAESYLALLGGNVSPPGPLSGLVDSALGLVFATLLLPLAGAIGILPYNFAGFYGDVANFYDVTGPLAAVGETPVFLAANVLFWTAWVNLQLGVFNCIPGYPLDGGRILRMIVEGAVSRLPVGDRERLVRTVTTSVGLVMLASLLLIMFGPQVLS